MIKSIINSLWYWTWKVKHKPNVHVPTRNSAHNILINDALVHRIMHLGENGQWKFMEMSLIFWLGTIYPHGLNSNFHFLSTMCRAVHALQSYFFIWWHLQILQQSNVLLTPLMKGQAWKVWKETQTTTRHFCSSLLCSEHYLLSKVPRSLSFFFCSLFDYILLFCYFV